MILAATLARASANRMEEEEIDAWYEEEKQKCMDDYLKEVEITKDYERAEKKYEDKLNKIISKYNQLMSEKIQNKKAGKFERFISNLKKRIYFFKEK